MSTLSDRLTEALAASGLKQADLARACGIKAPSVNAWISGRTKNLKGENLVRIAAVLGVNIAWLASGTGPMRPGASTYLDKQAERGDARESDAAGYTWPFKSVSIARYAALPADEKAQIERYALLLVTDWERRAAEKSAAAA